LNQELNIKYGFADADIQKNFDKFGKLPRISDIDKNTAPKFFSPRL